MAQTVLALVSGQLVEVEVASGGIAELAVDPTPVNPGDTWVLRTNENPANTLQAFIGGFIAATAFDDNKYELSYRTMAGQTVRTLLT